jgi:glycosyltransferase involved in cell wall biosynthesis
MAELAPRNDARLEFLSVPERPFPLALLEAPGVLWANRGSSTQVLVLDSIAAAYLGPWLTVRPSALPVIGMLHQPPGGIDYGPPRKWIQAGLDRLAYRHARSLMVASESLAEQLAAEGLPPTRLTVVPPGRDVAEPGPPAGDLRRGRAAAFLCVGNWMARKGIHSLLEAFARLPDEAATLHLAGDDRVERRYTEAIRLRLARRDLAGRVAVHGPLPRELVASLYAAADAFVLPSLKEPYGTVYGEAMAFGLPVVGWRAGNLPYLADHEREGLVLRPGDLAGLAQALERLAFDEPFRRRLGAAARARALTRPTWEETAAKFFGTIRATLKDAS